MCTKRPSRSGSPFVAFLACIVEPEVLITEDEIHETHRAMVELERSVGSSVTESVIARTVIFHSVKRYRYSSVNMSAVQFTLAVQNALYRCIHLCLR